ncbi:MAG: SAM-dependent chlorinase/fluorinase [Planctomycetota bacterium]|nr:SAM-dependent chlorinase/fluorinase [Planctomycetota bacterium]
MRPSGVVALLSDLGATDPYVGMMKGMLLRAHPRSVIIDLLHDVPSQDVALGGFFMRAAIGRFPPGTIHLGVVDPGAGTGQAVLCAYAHGCFWIAPDNGLLGEVVDGDAEVRLVDLEHLGLTAQSRTFHGRDVFGPLAGMLASGRCGFTSLGPRTYEIRRVPSLLEGKHRVVHVDNHGNLVTNVSAVAIASVRGLRVAGRLVPLRGTYADAAPGDLVALVNSYDLVEIGENEGRAAVTLAIGRGAPIELQE